MQFSPGVCDRRGLAHERRETGVRSPLLGVYDVSGVLHYAGNFAPPVTASHNDTNSNRVERLKQKTEAFSIAPQPDQDRD
ncbi:ATP-dependent DNA ligase clustered with Ku protein, LigD [Caballeronia sordidicola]|uniref:ATP-dependent DNA ligase clustered with Ku protein, LigD n=1 Tax=Caballeronia sordidicola TaxID=196367 RepID=A0A242MXF7_CABSO|nr:ATP-dependent DNA ligase clustered with Ku protein, LigD [Caballeronia sordidicola]